MYNDSELDRCREKMKEMYDQMEALRDEHAQIEEDDGPCDRLEKLNREIEDLSVHIRSLIENDYSQAVFNAYKDEKPPLIRILTGETVTWDDAFGDDFEKISRSLRHSLVGLVEDPGRYRFK